MKKNNEVVLPEFTRTSYKIWKAKQGEEKQIFLNIVTGWRLQSWADQWQNSVFVADEREMVLLIESATKEKTSEMGWDEMDASQQLTGYCSWNFRR